MSSFFSMFKLDLSSVTQNQRVHSQPDQEITPKQAGKWGTGMFSMRKKKEMTPLDELLVEWKQFRTNLDKIITDPLRYQQNTLYLEEKLKPHLQKILNIVLDEDQRHRENRTVGECLEEVLRQGMIMDLCAYGQTDNPEGLFIVTLKFLNYIISDVRSTELINHSKVHPALMQFLKFIYNSIKNDIMKIGPESEEKVYILTLIQTLTVKIQEDPSLVNFFFSESRNIKSKGPYIPLHILLHLLIREEISEPDDIKTTLRKVILLHLKLNDSQILKYLVEESEICVILVIKLASFFNSVPMEIELIANNEVVQMYPDDEDSKYLSWMNLLEQIAQIFPYESKQAHIEFVQFCAFINQCAISIQHSERLIDNLCSSLFNNFLLDVIQPRLLKGEKPRLQRTAVQYLIQMADIFTSSQLIEVIYRFMVGLPQQMQPLPSPGAAAGNQILAKQKSPFHHSRTMSIEQPSGSGSGRKKESLVGDLHLRLQRINFESKNAQSSYAINHPYSQPMGTPVQSKAAKINAAIAQVLEQVQSSIDDSSIDYQSKINPDSLIQQYYAEAHKSKKILQMLFKFMNQKEEKLNVAVLKLFETIILKDIPSISKHLYLDGLQKLLSWHLQGGSDSQQSSFTLTVSLTEEQIKQAKEKFLTNFPVIRNQFQNFAQNQVELLSYIHCSLQKTFDSLSILVNEPKRPLEPSLSFSSPSSSRPVHGSHYEQLYTQDPWVFLRQYDGQILQTPKRHFPPFPTTYQLGQVGGDNESEDYTVATENEEEFMLMSPMENPKYHQHNQGKAGEYRIHEPNSRESSLMPVEQMQDLGSISYKSQSQSVVQPHEDYQAIDPATFSQKGEFLKEMFKKLTGFLGNSVEENLILTSIISHLCNTPVPLVDSETRLRNVHSKLTLLHIFLFECPNSGFQSFFEHGQLVPILKQINEEVDELLQDSRFVKLVKVARQEGNLVEQTIRNNVYRDSQSMMEYFQRNKKLIYAAIVYQEFLKEVAASLFTKELMTDMVEAYEQAYLEDLKLECALEKFKDYSCTEIN